MKICMTIHLFSLQHLKKKKKAFLQYITRRTQDQLRKPYERIPLRQTHLTTTICSGDDATTSLYNGLALRSLSLVKAFFKHSDPLYNLSR